MVGMDEKYVNLLNNQNIVLASGSPRRKDILESMGLRIDCKATNVDESQLCPSKFPSMSDYVKELAVLKMKSVKPMEPSAYLIITADTILVCEGIIYGKPITPTNAANTLHILSGKTHEVYTSVCLDWTNRRSDKELDVFYAESKIKMKSMSEAEIEEYVSTGEPLDKAGAIGIQGIGSRFVKYVKGDWDTVVGFPTKGFVEHVRNHLDRKNVT